MKTPAIRILLAVYLLTIMIAVLFVPWKVSFGGMEISKGYAFLFSRPIPGASVEYGTVALELLAITAVFGAVIAVGSLVVPEIFRSRE